MSPEFTPADPASSAAAGVSSSAFNELLEVIPDAVVIIDRAGMIVQVNQQAEKMFGYARTELQGQPLAILLPDRFHTMHGGHLTRYFANPRTRPMGAGLELFGQHKDGLEFAVEISLSPITLHDTPHVISTIRDVTERKRLERRTHDALNALLHMAEMMVLTPSDPASTDQPAAMHGLARLSREILNARRVAVLAVEPAQGKVQGLALAGMSPEEEHAWAANWSLPKHFSPSFKARLLPRLVNGAEIVIDLDQSPFGDALAFQPWLAESPQRALIAPMQVSQRLVGVLVVQTRDPHQIFAADELSLVKATTRLAAMLLDRDRLLREREAYRETEERRALLQTVIDELPSGIYLVRGHDARLVLANRAAEAVWGAPWPVGMPMLTFLEQVGTRIFQVDGHQKLTDDLVTLRAVRTGEAIRQQQEIFRRADGSALPVLVNAVGLDPVLVAWSPSGNASSEPGAVVVLQDVTALKEAEQLKDEFIAIATHELRNPAAVLKGYASMLAREMARNGEALDEWQREAIDAINGATKQLVELTDELLDVTRLQAGRLELRRTLQDLIVITQRVAARLQVTTTRHSLEVIAPAAYLVAEVDQQRIEQVLSNIITNAIKYSPEGGLITITIQADEEHQEAIISVHDAGIGIPADQAARMFNRFARADNARMLGIEGTGLGLYLCRAFVEQHGGRIWFASVEGQGSTFTFTLPLSNPDHLDDNGDGKS